MARRPSPSGFECAILKPSTFPAQSGSLDLVLLEVVVKVRLKCIEFNKHGGELMPLCAEVYFSAGIGWVGCHLDVQKQ